MNSQDAEPTSMFPNDRAIEMWRRRGNPAVLVRCRQTRTLLGELFDVDNEPILVVYQNLHDRVTRLDGDPDDIAEALSRRPDAGLGSVKHADDATMLERGRRDTGGTVVLLESGRSLPWTCTCQTGHPAFALADWQTHLRRARVSLRQVVVAL
jgi:hypothetical protein